MDASISSSFKSSAGGSSLARSITSSVNGNNTLGVLPGGATITMLLEGKALDAFLGLREEKETMFPPFFEFQCFEARPSTADESLRALVVAQAMVEADRKGVE